LPSIGRLEVFDLGTLGRIETGVEQGLEISPFYDPMIAKLIVHADTRSEAIDALSDIAGDAKIWPVKSNAGFLRRLLSIEEFGAVQLDTGLIAHLTDDTPGHHVDMAAISWRMEEFEGARYNGDIFTSPEAMFGFRLNSERKAAELTMRSGSSAKTVTVMPAADEDDWAVSIDGKAVYENGVAIPAVFGPKAEEFPDSDILVFADGFAHKVGFGGVRGDAAGTASDGTILSPMPGKIIAVAVAEGDSVTKGDKLVTLEAMKMEHTLTAPFDGVVTNLSASEGKQVSDGVALVEIVAAED